MNGSIRGITTHVYERTHTHASCDARAHQSRSTNRKVSRRYPGSRRTRKEDGRGEMRPRRNGAMKQRGNGMLATVSQSANTAERQSCSSKIFLDIGSAFHTYMFICETLGNEASSVQPRLT
eukprot:GHVU01108886.1.p1 GENE.GHVU01108886.1~~GHVU01108886.1.p1  ORF type:complete len:121 (-),score=9.05 GHVU01108886.1:491-853(-)